MPDLNWVYIFVMLLPCIHIMILYEFFQLVCLDERTFLFSKKGQIAICSERYTLSCLLSQTSSVSGRVLPLSTIVLNYKVALPPLQQVHSFAFNQIRTNSLDIHGSPHFEAVVHVHGAVRSDSRLSTGTFLSVWFRLLSHSVLLVVISLDGCWYDNIGVLLLTSHFNAMQRK